MKGSVYSMIESTPTHGQAWWADSNHQSSSISQPSGHSRFSPRGPPDATVLNSCPIPSILPSLAPTSSCRLCFSQSTMLLLYLLLTRRSLKSQSGNRPRCRHQFGVSKEIDFVLYEASGSFKSGSSGSVCYYHSSVSLTH